MEIHLDVNCNGLDNPIIKKQIEDNIRQNNEKKLPEIIARMKEIPPLLTADVGVYSRLLDEAKECYKLGLYHATIAMVGITAERFAMELLEKIKFKINESEIVEKDLFEGPIQKQRQRLNILERSKLLKPEYAKKLREISKTRNKYVHPKDEGNTRKDSLNILKLYIEILNSRFSDDYTIVNGKIVKRI
jgi:hypothetical protein